MLLKNFFIGFQGNKKEITPQGFDKNLNKFSNAAVIDEKSSKKIRESKNNSDNKKDSSMNNPSPAMTANQFFKPRPVMKHKQSMKLGKDILNTLAFAAKKATQQDEGSLVGPLS